MYIFFNVPGTNIAVLALFMLFVISFIHVKKFTANRCMKSRIRLNMSPFFVSTLYANVFRTE